MPCPTLQHAVPLFQNRLRCSSFPCCFIRSARRALIALQWDPGDGQATGYIVYLRDGQSSQYTQNAECRRRHDVPGRRTERRHNVLLSPSKPTTPPTPAGTRKRCVEQQAARAPPPGGGGGGGSTPPPGGGSGGSGGSGSGSTTAPPPAGSPGRRVPSRCATAVRQDRFVDLTWDVPARGATGYRIEVGRQSGQTDVSGLTRDARQHAGPWRT